MAEMIRVNTRISPEMMKWLDDRTEETGIPKSTLIMLALEEYRKQHEVMNQITVMSQLLERLEVIEKELKQQKEK